MWPMENKSSSPALQTSTAVFCCFAEGLDDQTPNSLCTMLAEQCWTLISALYLTPLAMERLPYFTNENHLQMTVNGDQWGIVHLPLRGVRASKDTPFNMLMDDDGWWAYICLHLPTWALPKFLRHVGSKPLPPITKLMIMVKLQEPKKFLTDSLFPHLPGEGC